MLPLRAAILFLIVILPGAAMASEQPLIVNYALKAAPFSFDQNGTMRGALPELMRTILTRGMGLKSQHHGYPWRRAQLLVAEGKADALCTVPTSQRRQYMVFSKEPVMTTRIGILYNPKNPRAQELAKLTTLEDLASFRIVDHNGNLWPKEQLAPKHDVHWVKTMDDAILLLSKNQYDVMVIARPGINDFSPTTASQYGLTGKYLGNLKGPTFHFGLRKDYPQAEALLKNFDQTLRRLHKSGCLRAIMLRTMF